MSAYNEFPADAYQTLIRRVHAPVFFDKLASHGIVPASAEEEAALLEMAGVLQNAEREERAKSASAGRSLIVRAADDLKAALAADGGGCGLPTSHDRQITKMASHAAGDPEVARACEEYLAYLAARAGAQE